jgi:hypothetical protein
MPEQEAVTLVQRANGAGMLVLLGDARASQSEPVPSSVESGLRRDAFGFGGNRVVGVGDLSLSSTIDT